MYDTSVQVILLRYQMNVLRRTSI